MQDTLFTVRDNSRIAKDIYKMTMTGDTSHITKPGQFVNIKLDGLYLRRPISVCDKTDGLLTVIYKTVGEGTEKLSEMKSGAVLDLLTGLGNGFDTSKSGESPVVIGGGVGTPPMYGLAKKLISEKKRVTVILGFNSESDSFFITEFSTLGAEVYVTTADGSVGMKGFVTDALPYAVAPSYFYACGPIPMLKALYNASDIDGQMSFEERMGCGFGVCMGCTCKTKYGYKRICRDGPVLEKGEIVW